ncbi:ABC transporter permease [Saliphagus sp. GCM10025308]
MEPKDYAIRRGLWAIPTLFGVTVFTFVLTRLAGSPIAMYTSRYATDEQVEMIRETYHLNEPIYVQYFYWLRGVLQGDLGWSATSGSTVLDALIVFAPATVELAVAGLLIALVISITLGTLAGRYQDTWIDHFSRSLAVAGVSTPQFWSALILVYIFFVTLGWFPLGRATVSVWNSIGHPTGMYTVDAILAGSPRAFFDALWHLAMPAVVLGYANAAVIMRHLRAEIVEKKNEEYVMAARARGIKDDTVYKRHIRRNSLIPTLTVAGLSFAFLLRGAILAEIVFNFPGLGRYVAQAALSNEFAPLMGFVLITSVAVMGVNLGVDILYAYLDPRTELGE